MTLVKLICAIALLAGGYYFSSNSKMTDLDKLAFNNNVEALASGEDNTSYYQCYGEGSIDCYGHKVAFKITGLSLE